MKISKKKGFGLLEVVIAAGIISIFAGGVVLLSVASLRSSVINKHRTQAAALAQEAIEGIRVIRDSAWIDQDSTTEWDTNIPLTTPSGSFNRVYYDKSDGKWKIDSFVDSPNCASGSGVENESWFKLDKVCFNRKLTIENGPNEISNTDGTTNLTSRKVKVIVTWSDYGKGRDVTVETLLTNWRAY